MYTCKRAWFSKYLFYSALSSFYECPDVLTLYANWIKTKGEDEGERGIEIALIGIELEIILWFRFCNPVYHTSDNYSRFVIEIDSLFLETCPSGISFIFWAADFIWTKEKLSLCLWKTPYLKLVKSQLIPICFPLYSSLICCISVVAASLLNSVYESFKDEDGFLYMYYSTEKTFGSVL